jgi:MarR family 2-MHQ and catechol resistance regulon transcriptional repressor
MDRKPDAHDLLIGLLLVQNLMERRSDSFFQPFGLTSAQFNILNLLGYAKGRMEQAALVDLLLVGKSSISIVLNRMVRDGLIRREEHARDRRRVVLGLTAKGHALWRKISPRYEASVEKILGALPTSRRPRFLDDLKVFHDAFLAEEGPPASPHRWPSYSPAKKLPADQP